MYAVDGKGCIPYAYIDGHPDAMSYSEFLQNRRRIHHIPYSTEHCYYMKLTNVGIDEKNAVSLTMEQFPLLKENDPTQHHHDIDHASALKEFTQYITNSIQRSTGDSRNQSSKQFKEQGVQDKTSTNYPWTKLLSLEHILF